MKKKIIIGMILSIILILNLNRVQAYSGEMDPKGYITLPFAIYITNGKGTGTISVSASGYDISYQKNDISESTFTSIATKNKEMETYYETINTEKQEKEANLTTLQTEYNNLVSSGTATEEKMNVAREKYDTAYAEYRTFLTTAETNLQKLQKELYALVPEYTSSWTKTTNTSDNVQLDFTNYSGKIYFILWAKIENGTDTYYDFKIYSNDIETEDEKTQQEGEWANAKVSIEQVSSMTYKLNISNVKNEESHRYYYFIGDENAKPEFSTELPTLSYDKDKSMFSIGSISKYLELAPEQYLYVYDFYFEDGNALNKMVLNKVKIEKPQQKKYTDVFWATFIAKNKTQILFNTPWGSDTVRNIHFRIGKISDYTILKNIYNKKSNAFEDLLNYAKNSNAFYDKTVKSNSSVGGYELEGALFADSEVSDGEYYFLYAVLEDENGKYVKTEGVTLARCSKFSGSDNAFYLFFYGDDNFSWKEFSSDGDILGNDKTIAPEKLPYAGVSKILIIIALVIAVGGIISYKKYRKYNFSK